MASTYSTNLAFELIGTGDQSGTWGNTTNTNIGTLIEQSISGYVTQGITDGVDTVITIPNGASGTARNMYIECTGALTAGRNLVVPANRKLYFIFNNTTGGFAVTVKVSGQTGIAVPNGKKVALVCNGTDIFVAENYLIGNITGSAASVTAAATFNNGGAGAASGTTFDGSVARTISYNTIGAPSTTGTNASGTWAISISGTAATATTATSVANPVTFNNGGAGAASGTTFNGSVAQTISYNTIGAPSTTGTNASGSWGINITGSSASCTGNAATATTAAACSGNTAGSSSSCTGNSATASAVSNTGAVTTAASFFVTFMANNTTSNQATNTATALTFNPSTGTLNSTVLNATSDRNAKTSITTIQNAIEIIQSLNGVRFNWKDNGLPSAGLIAQDVQTVMPELVTEEDHKLSLNYNGIIGALVEAVKVLAQRVEDLENR